MSDKGDNGNRSGDIFLMMAKRKWVSVEGPEMQNSVNQES